MNETLDTVFARCQQLPDEDLGVLLSALMREQKERDCRAQKAAWARVCEAITYYTSKFGDISVADYRDDEDVIIPLYHGQFTFSEYGDIEVGA